MACTYMVHTVVFTSLYPCLAASPFFFLHDGSNNLDHAHSTGAHSGSPSDLREPDELHLCGVLRDHGDSSPRWCRLCGRCHPKQSVKHAGLTCNSGAITAANMDASGGRVGSLSLQS